MKINYKPYVYSFNSLIKNTIFKNFSILTLGHLLSQLIMFFAYAILAHRVSVDNFGKFGFAQAYYSYFLLFNNLGLSIYGVKKISLLKSQSERILLINKIISIRLIIFLLIVIPYLVLPLIMGKDRLTYYTICFMIVSLFLMVFNLDWYFQGRQKMSIIAIASIFKSMIFLIPIYLIIKNDNQFIYMGLIFAICFTSYVLTIFIKSRLFNKIKLFDQLSDWLPILRESVFLGLSFILIQIYYNFAILILGITRQDSEVAYFSAAHKIIMFFLTLISIYLKTVFPQMAKISNDKVYLYSFINKLSKISSVLAIFVSLCLFIFAKYIIIFAFGMSYFPAVSVFRILIIIIVIIASRTLIENSLIILDKTKLYLKTVLIGASFNIILNVLFIPYFGIIAAAINTVISEFVFSILAVYFSKFYSRDKFISSSY